MPRHSLHVGSTTSATKLIAGSRSHGFPLSLRLNGVRPAGHITHATHTRTPPTRTSPGRGRGAPASGRAHAPPLAASLRCGGGGSGWVSLSPTLRGVGANRPPWRGGSLRNLGRFRTSVNLENLVSWPVTSVTFKLQDFMFHRYILTLMHYLTVRPTNCNAHTGYILGHTGCILVAYWVTLVHTGCADWVQSDCSDWCSNGVLKWVSHAAYAGLKIG